jgi:hypothetical protein
MPRKSAKDKERRADLLAKVPPAATRVLVRTAKGDQKYKPIADLADTDRIQTNKHGDPIVMKGKPGRKSAVDVGPANATVAEILKRKSAALDSDEILVQMKANPESADLLQAIIVGLGEESASLKFEREEAAREGKDTSGYSTKRVQALRATAETWLKRMDQLTAKSIDLDSPGFGILFKFIMDTFREAMNGAKLRPEQVETIFAKFSSMVDDDWKVEAKGRMKRSI